MSRILSPSSADRTKTLSSVPAFRIRMSEVLSALSYALDLTEGQPAGHCVRACWIGMHIGRGLGLNDEQLGGLYYALLLKDAGCSSNAARLCELYGSDDLSVKRAYKTVDNQRLFDIARFVFTHAEVGESLGRRLSTTLSLAIHRERLANEVVGTRCERGADIALALGFNEQVADGVRYLDEHWNGRGRPYRKRGEEIPIYSRIALLAQVVDVFATVGGPAAARREAAARAGIWFDPTLVDAFMSLGEPPEFWEPLKDASIVTRIQTLEPPSLVLHADDDALDRITTAFSLVVDSKSSFTYNHSSRVADVTIAIAEEMGLDAARRRWLWRGALLHDIGKLGVSNAILDKPGRLTDDDWVAIKMHPVYSEQILRRVEPFAQLAVTAGGHHERLDGKGYPRGIRGEEIPLETRILTVADIYDALTATRPYRQAMSFEEALRILNSECGSAIDPDVLDALRRVLAKLDIHQTSKA